jgi:drug/metabolite transporter (DMT)-like permease
MVATVSRSMSGREWGMLLTLSVLWGGAFFFAQVALRELPPLTVTLFRVGIAAAVLVGAVCATGRRLPRGARLWLSFLIMGLLNNVVPFSLILASQQHVGGGLAAILNATTPVFTVLLAHFATADEKLTAGRLAGVLLGCAGVGLIIGPDALAGFDPADLGQVCILGGAVSYACASLYGRRFASMPPLVSAAGQLCAATAVMLPVAAIVETPWSLPPPEAVTVASVVAIAVLSTATAYILYFRILATAGASNLLLVTFLIPVSAIALGAGFLGERLDGIHAAGLAVIATGLAAIDGRVMSFRWPGRAKSVQ